MKQNPIVIIGAGQCGLKAAETLRQQGYDGDLVLIGDEPHAPYQRPPLSKAFLKGEIGIDRLMLKGPDFYGKLNIEALLSQRAVEIDAEQQKVMMQDGRQIAYGQLLLATGTRSRRIEVPGLDLPGVFSMRTIADVEAMTAAMKPGMKIAIIGGGYIGLEVAAALRSFNYEVTVIEGAERLLQRVVCPQMSAYFHQLHSDHGVDVHVASRFEAIEGRGQAERVRLADGTAIEADMVLMAVGATFGWRACRTPSIRANMQPMRFWVSKMIMIRFPGSGLINLIRNCRLQACRRVMIVLKCRAAKRRTPLPSATTQAIICSAWMRSIYHGRT